MPAPLGWSSEIRFRHFEPSSFAEKAEPRPVQFGVVSVSDLLNITITHHLLHGSRGLLDLPLASLALCAFPRLGSPFFGGAAGFGSPDLLDLLDLLNLLCLLCLLDLLGGLLVVDLRDVSPFRCGGSRPRGLRHRRGRLGRDSLRRCRRGGRNGGRR